MPLNAIFNQSKVIDENVNWLKAKYPNWMDSKIQGGMCLGLSLKWTQLHIATGGTDQHMANYRMGRLRYYFIHSAVVQVAWLNSKEYNIIERINELGVNLQLKQTGQVIETKSIPVAANHVLGTPGYHQFCFRKITNGKVRAHATACYTPSGPGKQVLQFFDPNFGEYSLSKDEFETTLNDFKAKDYKHTMEDFVITSIMGQKEKKFLQALRDACIDYEKSLKRWFRRPSTPSKQACYHLQRVLILEDVPKLRKMVRWYMGFDRTMPGGTSLFGSPLKDDSKFKQILKEAFHGNSDVFFYLND